MNTHAVPFADNDSYQFNPWRAPGQAPVIDPCGQAGGKYKQTPVGGDSVFVSVNVAGKAYAMGALGSEVLPPTPEKDVTTWKVGSTPRVAWGMRYNHGKYEAIDAFFPPSFSFSFARALSSLPRSHVLLSSLFLFPPCG